MSEIDEYVKKLNESAEEVEPLSAEGGDRIRDIIELVKNINEGDNKKKALALVMEILERMEEYETYVPTSVAHFRFLKEEFSK